MLALVAVLLGALGSRVLGASVIAAKASQPFAAVDAALRRRVASAGLSGATAVVVGPRDAVLHRYSVGAMRSSTRLPIASASKWLTAAMVMALVDRGRLSLDDRVERFLPAFGGDKAGMTVRQLLSHSSGLTTAACVGDPTGTLAQCVTSLATDSTLAAAPGREFHYSNDGYQVAGRIVEVLTGTSFERAFEDLVGRPVGMRHTRFDTIGGVRTRNPAPAASAVSTVDDYRRFLAMVAHGGMAGSRRVLSAASVAEIERDQVHGLDTSHDPAVAITHIPTYGLGVWRDVTNAADQAQVVSGNGALGFYPWLDLVHQTYGIVAVDDRRGPEVAVPASQRVARRERSIAAAHTTMPTNAVTPPRVVRIGGLAVGIRTELFVDPTRPTPPNRGAPGSPTRSMPTTIWYPGATPDRSTPASDVPPDRAHGPYPLVVFAHGFNLTPPSYGALLARLASAGYVVVAPALPLLNADAPGGPSHGDYGPANIADFEFVVSEALRRAATPGNDLYGLVDSTRVAVAGHSDGEVLAYALAFESCCHDPRVKAAVLMAGNLANSLQAPIPTGVAVLHMLCELDQYNPYTNAIAFDRSSLLAPSYSLTLLGARHFPPFSDPADPHFDLVIRATIDILDATLKDSASGVARLGADVAAAGPLAALESHHR